MGWLTWTVVWCAAAAGAGWTAPTRGDQQLPRQRHEGHDIARIDMDAVGVEVIHLQGGGGGGGRWA
jgi:hypothetical protein